MLTTSTKGLLALAPTPFHEDGRIDERSIDRLVDFYIEAGCSGMMVLGIMGEAQKLDHFESVDLVRRAISRAGSLLVGVGVSAPGFAAMRSLSRAVMDLGAAGVMIAPPSTLKTDDQIVAYYSQAVEAIGSDVPFVLQDIPQWTGVVMTPEVISRIVRSTGSCVMIKHEEMPGLDKMSTLREMQRAGTLSELSIVCGNGGLFLDFEMDRGADGAMTGYCFSDSVVEVIRLSHAGQRDKAHDLYDAHLPLLRYEHQGGVGLAVRKYVLKRRGILESHALRRPGHSLSEATIADVEYLLKRLAKVDARARF